MNRNQPTMQTNSNSNKASTSRAAKRSCTHDSDSDHDSNNASDSFSFLQQQSFPRWLIIEGTDTGNPLNVVSPFALGKALSCQIGTLKTVKRLQRGGLLVETDSHIYSKSLLNLTCLAGVPVKVSPHRSLNVSKGVIRNRDVAQCSQPEIVSELKSQGVTDAFVITVPDGDGRRRTNTVILTFSTPHPPKHINAGYLRLPVQLYIPNPLRCFNCQKFGHGKNSCKGQLTCARCGSTGHEHGDCHNPEKCVNCGSTHSAFSKTCPKWQLEKRVQQVKAEKGISFVEARKFITSETAPKTTLTTSFASVSSHPIKQAVNTNVVCSVQTQTDLTWPESCKEPRKVDSSLPSTSKSTCTAATNTGGDPGCSQRQKSLSASPPRSRPPVKQTRESHDLQSKKGKGGRPKIVRPPSQPAVSIANKYESLDSDAIDDDGE